MQIFLTLAEQGRRLLSSAADVFEFLNQEISDLPVFRELGLNQILYDVLGLPLDASILTMVLFSWIYGIVTLNLIKWIKGFLDIF